MLPPILVAGIESDGLLSEAPLLQRTGQVVEECPSAQSLLTTLPLSRARLVVLGPRLQDIDVIETIRRIRGTAVTRRVSVLVLIGVEDPPDLDGLALRAGANAVLRRPLDPSRLESWLAKLLVVPGRVEGRVAVQAQVLGTQRHEAPKEFEGQARNLSVHGMLLTSPTPLAPEPDLEFRFDLPPTHRGLRALGRVVREAKELPGPNVGYGIEFLFLPPESVDAIVGLLAGPPWRLGLDLGRGLYSTFRRDSWIYEIHKPLWHAESWHVEIHRAPREGWRAGHADPVYVVESVSPEGALGLARDFVRRHG